MTELVLKIFNEYGWAGLFVALIVIILIYLFNKQDKSMVKHMSALIEHQNESLTTGIGQMIENQNKNFHELLGNQTSQNKELLSFILYGNKEAHNQGLAKREESLIAIDKIIKKLQIGAEASRVTVIEFHNSKENMNGLPFKWYDIQAEQTKRGILPIMGKVKDMQIYGIIHIIEKVNASETNFIVFKKQDLDNLIDIAPSLYYNLVEERDTKLIIYIGLYNESNVLIGLLTLEYDYDYDIDSHLGTIDEKRVMEQAKIIEKLLESSE